MHDIRWIRDNAKEYDRRLGRRALNDQDRERFSSKALMALDEARRTAIAHLERALARRNAASKEIGEAKRRKDDAHAEDLMIEVAQLKTAIPELEKTPRELEAQLSGILSWVPNLPFDDVPDGADEHSNVERHHFGAKKVLGFPAKPHFDLGDALDEMDFATATKLSGARFVVLKRGLARLERALGQFMLDVHTQEHGYTEVNPPLLVRDEAMFGTTQLPKFAEDQFSTTNSIFGYLEVLTLNREMFAKQIPVVKEKIASIENSGSAAAKDLLLPDYEGRLKEYQETISDYDRVIEETKERAKNIPKGLWLIPTAEVSLTNLVRESILDEKELPLRFTALTPCFRAEAGAAGRDTRGMIRQHQFNKVELVSITTPETSRDEHERMLSCAEEILRRLDLHYRVVTLCAGDMGFASHKTYDIEVWMPGQGEGGMYREISSCSVCGDFQARRMNARYRGPDNKPRFVHTLNGSGTAVGRALIAVMETYQQQGGSIAVPDALQPYMGGKKTIEKGE